VVERRDDLRVARGWRAIEQGFRCHDHARRAEAALNGSFFDKRSLQGMDLAVSREVLNGLDNRLLSLGHSHLDDATSNGLAV
jgi:hypothetical protein